MNKIPSQLNRFNHSFLKTFFYDSLNENLTAHDKYVHTALREDEELKTWIQGLETQRIHYTVGISVIYDFFLQVHKHSPQNKKHLYPHATNKNACYILS